MSESISIELKNELLMKCEYLQEKYSHCANCENMFDNPNDIIITYIFWNKYNFCGELCRWDLEDSIRKSYRNSLRKKQA